MNKSCIDNDLDHCCSAPCEILHSVALEEAALSHILNAEGEKIQKAVAMKDATIQDLLCINSSVAKTIREVTSLELVLLSKLEAACSFSCHPAPAPINNDGWICAHVFDCETQDGLCGAKITISKNNQTVCDGYTNHDGEFVSDALPFGWYFVKIEYKNLEPKIYEVDIKNHCCNNLNVCFNVCNSYPPSVAPTIICIKGQVTNNNGNPVANACVIAKGIECEEVRTDNCGFYEITQLKVGNHFSITPKCGCCVGKSRELSNISKKCYNIDLKIQCHC